MPRNVPLSDADREAIRDMRDRYPRMSQEEIGKCFGVTGACVHNVLTYVRKPISDLKVLPSTPACTVQQPGSIIRPIPLSRLMARR